MRRKNCHRKVQWSAYLVFFALLFQVMDMEAYNLTLGLLMSEKLKPIAELAIDDVNSAVFSSIGIRLSHAWKPLFECNDIVPIGLASDLHQSNYSYSRKNRRGETIKGVDAYIGPVADGDNDTCSQSCKWASYYSAAVHKPMVTPACMETKRIKEKVNDVFVRTAFLPIRFKAKKSNNTKTPKSIIQFNRLLDIFNWNKVRVIVSQKYYQSAQNIENGLVQYTKLLHKKDKNYEEKEIEVSTYNNTDFQNEKSISVKKFYEKIDGFLKSDARIYFLHGRNEENARILVKARQKKMFDGNYAFITTEFKVKEKWAKAEWLRNSNMTIEQAFDGFLDFSTPSVKDKAFNKFKDKVKKSMKNRGDGNLYKDGTRKVTEKEAYLYDAIRLYAIAYKKAKENGSDPDDIKELMKEMSKVKFEGASGMVQIDSAKDRGFDSYVLNYFNNGTVVESCTVELNDSNIKPCKAFKWPGNRIPKDRADKKEEEGMGMVTIVFISIAVILIGLTIAAFVLYKRNKYGNNDLVGKGFVIDADEINKLINHKNETESNQSVEQNGKAGGSLGSRSPMLPMEVRKSDTMDKMGDAISMGSCAESVKSLKEKNVFKYKGQFCILKRLQRSPVSLSKDKECKIEFKQVRDIHDTNLCAVVGVCVQHPNVGIIEQWCSKRSLLDILQNEGIDLDMMFKMSFASDIAHGATELHRHGIVHGRLTSSNCVIDNRWVCKITDYGMDTFREEHYQKISQDNDYQTTRRMLWKAPELLQGDVPRKPTKEGDVYSFGIILSEIMTREDPYADSNEDLKVIVNKVKANSDPPFRPTIPDDTIEGADLLIKTMKSCWEQNPHRRPTFDQVKTALKPKGSMMDNMILRLEKYANDLEEKVDERNQELHAEQTKNEGLLYKMLPMAIADQLKNGQEVSATAFDCVTIFFSDIVGFTAIAADSSPMQVVALLNDLYTCFDNCSDHYDVYKVETIGDAYMVVSGLPILNEDRHAGEIATMALDLLHNIKSFKIRHLENVFLQLRIGIHSGPCVAGVVGLKMPRYCLFGDTVNYASRMESSGLALRVHVSPECKSILDNLGGYQLEYRGLIAMKGKGEIDTYFLTGKEGFNKSLPDLNLAAGLDQHDFK